MNSMTPYTPGLKRLIDNACAVLMPSFGEGYGLPVHEAEDILRFSDRIAEHEKRSEAP